MGRAKGDVNTERTHSIKTDTVGKGSDKSEDHVDSFDSCVSSEEETDSASGGSLTNGMEVILNKETKVVRHLKLAVIAVLLISVIITGYVVHVYLRNVEQKDFENQFSEDSVKILSTMSRNIDRILEAMDALTVSMVSFARATNQTWPFVVIPDFAVRAEKIRAIAGAVYINTYHSVSAKQRAEWEHFTSIPENHEWVNNSIALMEENPDNPWPIVWNHTMWYVIHGYDEWDKEEPGVEGTNHSGPYLPIWQIMPVIPVDPPFNWDANTIANRQSTDQVFETHEVSLSEAYLIHLPDADPELIQGDEDEAAWISDYLTEDEDPMEPISDYLYPIIDSSLDQLNLHEGSNKNESNVVGILSASVYWRDALKDILPKGSKGLHVVFENECNPTFTYEVNGADVKFLGAGDLHQTKYDNLVATSWLNDLYDFAIRERAYSGHPLNKKFCPFHLSIYPSDAMKSNHTTSNPITFPFFVVLVFAFTSVLFILYDWYVERRHRLINSNYMQNKTMVDKLFPAVVQERIKRSMKLAPKTKIGEFLDDSGFEDSVLLSGDDDTVNDKNPVAELFPHTTVIFADISGFTAWASVRDPTQVFTLLESLYAGFDRVAKQRKVFKVETIGDCYVAVTGLPAPMKDHAVVMCKFAKQCRTVIRHVTRELETKLGPGTADLSLRIGLHSGPITAGVLRGEKARLQLFGDTVNTAARMESTGKSNKIQVSQKTADLLILAKKEHWLIKREDLVNAKGKGELQTYFVEPRKHSTGGVSVGSAVSSEGTSSDTMSPESEDLAFTIEGIDGGLYSKSSILVDWNISIFEGLLEELITCRTATKSAREHVKSSDPLMWEKQEGMVRDEVAETINMPAFDPKSIFRDNIKKQGLSHNAKSQLCDFIRRVADMYPDNSFHNFEHASHVMMSIVKLLQRICTRDADQQGVLNDKSFYAYTYGMSDPLTKLSIAFAALIHDADHQGVPNGQLVKEECHIADLYNNKSVAEQNSIDLVWELLMQPTYDDLRAAIYTTEEELDRFRQLVVNCVIATDIFDKELKTAREARWKKAFSSSTDEIDIASTTNVDDWRRKATIVIEYIIQASDVAHTMQHWHVYQKWNGKLFRECYHAYKFGRTDKDPSLGWYAGELWFFDNYIIPLAKKLRECEVFGVACDEFLHFACANRGEWELKGRDIVKELKEEAEELFTSQYRFM